ncbi:MAG: ferredoxin-thioredoxin reductase variable chain [Nodosilinea sp.]
MNIGDHVRIKESLILYHHPLRRNEAFDAKGMEGKIVGVLSDYKGRPISPNYPIQVEFEVEGAKRPLRVHLRAEELEVV